MKWSKIRQQYPDKFILIGNLVEESISNTKSKILEGEVLEVSDDGKEIRKKYREYKQLNSPLHTHFQWVRSFANF